MTTRGPAIPFEQFPVRNLELDTGTIAYRESGSGEPIVFVHGLLVNGFLWRKVAPSLASRFRCIVPDWPLGSHRIPMPADADLSPPGLAKVIIDFLDALDLRNVTLVANDTGGALAQIAAVSGSSRIGRLVLTPCDMFDNFLPPMFRPLQWIGSKPGGVFLVAQPMRLRFVRNSPLAFGWLAKRPIESSVAANYVEPILKSGAIRRDVSKVLKGISPRYTQEAADKLRDFKHPALLAWAAEDRFFPVEHARRMASILPNARVELIEDSYSFVPEDQPERLASMIGEFLAATELGCQ
jgi:pimeloyl-ACP methyl ester carboxylesterase